MNAVSVESVNLLLAFSKSLQKLQDRFHYGVECLQSDTGIIINNAWLKYNELCRKCDDAQKEVDNCQEEVDRLDDEIDYLRSCRDDYDPDDYHYEMDSLSDELDDAESALSDARDELDRARDKKDESQSIYYDIRYWCEQLCCANESIIDNDFDNCRKFIEKYGSYLVDALKNV